MADIRFTPTRPETSDPSMDPEVWRLPTQQEKEDAKQRILDERFAKVNKNLKITWDALQKFKCWTQDQLAQISESLKTGSTRDGITSLREMQDKIAQLDEEVGELWEEVFPDSEGRGSTTDPTPSPRPDFS